MSVSNNSSSGLVDLYFGAIRRHIAQMSNGPHVPPSLDPGPYRYAPLWHRSCYVLAKVHLSPPRGSNIIPDDPELRRLNTELALSLQAVDQAVSHLNRMAENIDCVGKVALRNYYLSLGGLFTGVMSAIYSGRRITLLKGLALGANALALAANSQALAAHRAYISTEPWRANMSDVGQAMERATRAARALDTFCVGKPFGRAMTQAAIAACKMQ